MREKFFALCALHERRQTKSVRVLHFVSSCFEKESLPSRSQQKKVPYGMFQVLLWVGWLWTSPFKVKIWLNACNTCNARCVQCISCLGIHGLFVEALNDKAKAFYKV